MEVGQWHSRSTMRVVSAIQGCPKMPCIRVVFVFLGQSNLTGLNRNLGMTATCWISRCPTASRSLFPGSKLPPRGVGQTYCSYRWEAVGSAYLINAACVATQLWTKGRTTKSYFLRTVHVLLRVLERVSGWLSVAHGAFHVTAHPSPPTSAEIEALRP